MTEQATISKHHDLLVRLGLTEAELHGSSDGSSWFGSGAAMAVSTPIDDSPLATVLQATEEEYDAIVAKSAEAFKEWRMVPAPQRGEIVRLWGNRLRELKEPLGQLVSIEMGKSLQEGLGEVQEMIDICDFAVGLSRQLYGNTMHSERPQHRMYEQWHPLGVVGVISAFNFPVAVYAWNAAIALVCGDGVVWKPSSKTPLTAIAVQKTLNDLLADAGHAGIAGLVIGPGRSIGDRLLHDKRLPLVSATGSCRVGERVAEVVSKRFGRTILELGGNNAIIVTPTADMDLAVRAVLFGAVGTAGQRCTSTRRVFIHESIKQQFTEALVKAYGQVTVGDPLDASNLMGPLIDAGAVGDFKAAVAGAKQQGAKLLAGGDVRADLGDCYVQPTVFDASDVGFDNFPLAQDETFAPVLYLFEYGTMDEAMAWHNGVPQGLSSAIFSNDVRETEAFLSAMGSDCGIANVNIGTSGAEIGGAFGGEKDTGGGRESGSDSWKQYMRRQTNTINWGKDLPLAQGITFDL